MPGKKNIHRMSLPGPCLPVYCSISVSSPIDDEHFKDTLQEIAHREARYVAQATLKGRAGGWSYFPDLPELPPDLDSLSAALHLFARVAPGTQRYAKNRSGLPWKDCYRTDP